MEKYNLFEHIDKHLNEQKDSPRNRDYIYVSEVGKSKKEIYDSIVNKKSFKANARLKRILENGNKVHERYLKLFAEMRILVAAEIDAVKEDFLHGRLDCIITDKKQNYVVEIKSCSQWTFNKLTKPVKNHNLQIQFYMYYINIPRGFILYENKDNQQIKCFDIELDKELVEEHIKELKGLKKEIDENIKPIKLEDLKYGT